MIGDVELVLIGCCLNDEAKLDDVTVTGNDFENPVYANIFDRMLERHRGRMGVSQALLSEDFPRHVDIIWGSTEWTSELFKTEAYDRAVQERSVRRRLKETALRIANWAENRPIEELEDACRAEVDEALNLRETRVMSMKDDARTVLAEHRKSVIGIPTPWPQLTKIIGGFVGGRMYVIAARPGKGKSALALQIAHSLAETGPVLFASMEMDKGEVYERNISQQASIYYGGMSKNPAGWMREREQEYIERGVRDLRVIDRGTQTVSSIRTAARSIAREGNLKGVVVDYLHLLKGEGRTQDNETVRIGEITRGLKQLAMDLKVPVIALSQLNRGVEAREDQKPTAADLRGSGTIEQDTDVTIFLYKDADNQNPEVLHVYVDKNRHGTGQSEFDLRWEGEFVRAV